MTQARLTAGIAEGCLLLKIENETPDAIEKITALLNPADARSFVAHLAKLVQLLPTESAPHD